MKLLAIETATEACSAALSVAGEIRERYEVAPQQHGELILAMAQDLLAEAALRPADLDAVVFGRGPGSFTGLRIAAGVAQGIAFAAEVPVLPVSTLAALAQQAQDSLEPGAEAPQFLAAIDARMEEVYWGMFGVDAQGLVVPVGDEVVCAPPQVPVSGDGPWLGVGSGWDTYHDILQGCLAPRTGRWLNGYFPRAAALCRLAPPRMAAGEAVLADLAAPVYLRNNVAHKKKASP